MLNRLPPKERQIVDLLYHLSVLLHTAGSSWEEVTAELKRRHASSATASS